MGEMTLLKYSQKERRLGPDPIFRTVQFLNFLCGALLISALLIIDRAKPRIETFFDRFFHVHFNKGWDHDLLTANLYVVSILCLLSIAGLLFNSMRARRKDNKFSKILIFSIIFSLAAIYFTVIYLPQ